MEKNTRSYFGTKKVKYTTQIYHPNHPLKPIAPLKRSMQKDKKQGLITKLHPNGEVKSEINYKNNQRHGLCIDWYENGHKQFESYWKDGKMHGVATYWSRDQAFQRASKRQETNHKDGAHHGLHSQWYENGQKEYETNYKGDVRHGMDSCWYENGQKESVEYFVLAKSYARIDWGKEGNVTKTELPTLPHPTTSPAKTNNHKTKTQLPPTTPMTR